MKSCYFIGFLKTGTVLACIVVKGGWTMYSIIVITHGKFASGLKDTLTMIAGEREGVYFVTFNPSDSVDEFDKRVKTIYRSIPKQEDVLFLGDLFGGTPTNVASRYYLKEPHRVQVVTGMNFPLLLSAALSRETNLFETIDGLIEGAQAQLKKIENETIDHNDDE